MKRFAIPIVCAMIVLVGGLWAYSAAAPPRPVGFLDAAAARAIDDAVAEPATAPTRVEVTASDGPRALNFIERRRYRLTIRKLRPLVQQVLAEGEVDPEDRTAVAAAVLEKHIDANPGAFEQPQGIDWDSLLEFIERLIPLILRIIDLFW